MDDPPRLKPPWDTRAWSIGAIGGLVGGLMFTMALFASPSGGGVLSPSLGLSSIALAYVITPMVLAGLARRRWLLWPYLPMLVWQVVSMMGASFAPDPSSPESLPSDKSVYILMAIVMILVPLLSALPVAFVRWLIVRRRKGEPEQSVSIEQMVPDIENAWPPRPNNSG